MPEIAFDSPQWFAGGAQTAVLDTSHQLQLLNGQAAPCTLITRDIGDDNQYTTLKRVRPRFLQSPQTGHLDAFYKNISGDALQEGERATLINGCFDMLWSARWHRCQLSFTGAVELNALNFELSPDGME